MQSGNRRQAPVGGWRADEWLISSRSVRRWATFFLFGVGILIVALWRPGATHAGAQPSARPTSVQPSRGSTASVRLPLVKQALRNNCETAALSMLLAARGVHIGQLALQRALPRSGPLDPIFHASGGLPIWGDPDRGFVGRANGGGASGGYGVYPPPIRALAAGYGVELINLSGHSSEAIYRRLSAGHPVMVWVGLSNGPYKVWRTPQGKRVRANFGEHTIVLTRLSGGRITLNDPLSGRRTSWTRASFERMWLRLGRRALSP
jgi:uncharacterized protein YvpB